MGLLEVILKELNFGGCWQILSLVFLVIAIEPWFLKTTDEIYQDPKDGWTLKSEDGSRGAHSEHTIAITENGPVILTVRD